MNIFLCKGSFFGPASGADQMIVNYAAHLRRAGHNPTVVIVVPFAADDPYHRRLLAAGVRVVCLGRHPLYRAQLAVRAVLKRLPVARRWSAWTDWENLLFRTCVHFLKRERPDVIHVLVEGGVFLKAARAAGVPAIYHECATPRYAAETDVFYRRLEASLPYAAGLAGVSPRHARLCLDRLPWDRGVGVIPILIEDPLGGRPLPGGSGGGPVFGFAARVERLKGPDLLVRAFAAVAREFPGASLRIAGTGDDGAAVAAEAAALGVADRCAFVGPYVGPAAMSAFMSGLDVLVHPSLAEGTPCSVIEAMAHGVPVVASAVGGVPDMLTPECGVLTPVGDVPALADAMLRLVRDAGLRRRLGAAARRRYEELFAPPAVIPLLTAAYDRAIRAGGREAEPTGLAALSHPWPAVVTRPSDGAAAVLPV